MKAVRSTEGVVSVRAYDSETDRSYVIRSWVMGLGGGKFVGVAVEHLVDDPSLRIQVACVTSSPDVLVGYAAAWPQQAPTTIYVRERWRGIGVERALFEASNV